MGDIGQIRGEAQFEPVERTPEELDEQRIVDAEKQVWGADEIDWIDDGCEPETIEESGVEVEIR